MKFAIAASLMIGLAACGGGDDDGPLPPGEIHVIIPPVSQLDALLADVWTHDADGVRVAHTVSRLGGEATLEVTDGGSVTVSYRYSEIWAVWKTVLAVAPGDDLTVRFESLLDLPPPAPTGVGTRLQIQMPSLPAGADVVTVTSPCAQGWGDVRFDGTARISVESHCSGPTTLVIAARESLGTALGYQVLPDVTLVADAMMTADAPWAAPVTWDLDVTGAAGVERVRALRYLGAAPTGHLDIVELAGLTAAGGATSGNRPALDGPAIFTASAGDQANQRRYTLETNEQPEDHLTVDLGSIPSPRPAQITTDGRHITWAAVPDAEMFEISSRINWFNNNLNTSVAMWSVVAPPGRTDVVLFDDVGYPFVGTEDYATNVFSVSVRAWFATWWPDYAVLRTGAPLAAAPAQFTTRSAYDGFTLDPLNP